MSYLSTLQMHIKYKVLHKSLVSLLSVSVQLDFLKFLLVPAHPGSPGQRAIKWLWLLLLDFLKLLHVGQSSSKQELYI